jgi:hypothetical protein
MNFRLSLVVQGESKSGCKTRIPLFERQRVWNPLQPLLINHRTTWRKATENILCSGTLPPITKVKILTFTVKIVTLLFTNLYPFIV